LRDSSSFFISEKLKYLPLNSVIYTTIGHLMFVYAETQLKYKYIALLENSIFLDRIKKYTVIYDYEGNNVFHSSILRDTDNKMYSKLVSKFGHNTSKNLYNKTPEELLKFF
jgi:hypothetical protein